MARYYYKSGEVTEPPKKEESKPLVYHSITANYPVSVKMNDFCVIDNKIPKTIPAIVGGTETYLEILGVEGDVVSFHALGFTATLSKRESCLKDLEWVP